MMISNIECRFKLLECNVHQQAWTQLEIVLAYTILKTIITCKIIKHERKIFANPINIL